MPALKADPGVTYHGYWSENDGSMISVEDGRGTQIGVVQHLPKHSPTGMNWGYRGSGPADAARSLLIATLGDEAACQVCRGTGRVVYIRENGDLVAEPFDPARHPWTRRGWQCECDGGYKRLPYPAFTEEFVTGWGREWVMSRAAIFRWLEQNQASWSDGYAAN
jgi:hypothetical protein